MLTTIVHKSNVHVHIYIHTLYMYTCSAEECINNGDLEESTLRITAKRECHCSRMCSNSTHSCVLPPLVF